MRLLIYNMLSSNIKGVTCRLSLYIKVEQVVEKKIDFNAGFLRNMFPKIDWKTLVGAERNMGYRELSEEALESSELESYKLLRKFHHALLELHLEEGAMVYPETRRKFSISKGIPNMILHEDEVLGRLLPSFLVGFNDN
ncbi:LOW QUALITY PROTEIN: multifunctional methyltransferase subunit TRM112-like protein At1g78190 [Carica papaya]|uniref:LOW QUALITY PROTEIN: multifunctional methyltransferase subunit TRM112-like protein At1g78190 n=1 Tax=Carica papaya TaxID=3649 RepID=UPI000B8C782A|nr:LOW QUALITY PROTEIN: multifunctional methyltransferase subunit TRM112-like protein At1g78190 [Carica papaya]